MMDDRPGPDAPAEGPRNDADIFLSDLLQAIRKRLWIVALLAIALSGTVVGLSLYQVPTYTASVKILVGQASGGNRGDALPYDAYQLQQATATLARLVDTRPVAEDVVQRLDLRTSPEDLLENLEAQQLTATQTIQIDYSDSSPERAQRVVNTVGDAFSSRVSTVSEDANAVTAQVWERAAVPIDPVSPHPLRNGLLALAMGVVLGIGLALLLEYLDDSWRSVEEMEQISGVPTFGVIPNLDATEGKYRGKGKVY